MILTDCCSCALWLLYGFKKPDFTIALVNTVGLCLQLLYIFIYHIYAESKVSAVCITWLTIVSVGLGQAAGDHFELVARVMFTLMDRIQ